MDLWTRCFGGGGVENRAEPLNFTSRQTMGYADVHLKWIYPDFNIPLNLLLLKFINSPAIASCVKRFQTGGKRNYRIGQDPRESWLSDPEFEIIPACARTAANTGDEEQWVRGVAGGHMDLYQALVLSQLPNITHLTIGYQHDLQFQYVSKMFRRVLCSDKPIDGLSGFHHLKRVDIYVDMTFQDFGRLVGRKYEFSDLLLFFYLPSIQDLRIVMPQDDERFSWPTTKTMQQIIDFIVPQTNQRQRGLTR